jgi:DNA-directed RNA polymerase specialized sigma24 family protein
MSAAIAYCGCGHALDQHIRGGVCQHVNRPSKRIPTSAPCGCRHFHPNPGITDSDEFVAKQVNHVVRKLGVPLEPVDREDLAQVMRISLWKASEKYDSRSHIQFGSFAAFELYQDAIDELRSPRMFGRHGQHRLPPALASAADDDSWIIDPVDPQDAHDHGDGRLARVVAEFTVDPPDAGSVDLRWATSDRDREALRAAGERRRRPDQSPEDGARVPAWHRGLAALTTTTEEAA